MQELTFPTNLQSVNYFLLRMYAALHHDITKRPKKQLFNCHFLFCMILLSTSSAGCARLHAQARTFYIYRVFTQKWRLLW